MEFDGCAIVRRAGYGDLEFDLCNCIGMCIDDLDMVLKAMFRARGEQQRLQIADAIGPILNEVVARFGLAPDEAGSFGNEAVKIGTKVGSDALDRIATQAKNRPLVTLAVAIGVGILIGMTSRRS